MLRTRHLFIYLRYICVNAASARENNVSKIRNIGLTAHIDAGKTTTSEQMLALSGVTSYVGSVDRGDTMMDFLPQEMERGITISSAAVTFQWNDKQINLIDTPGHVDFTVEVERSLRVLDGTVTLINATAGVQSQTEAIWQQANRYRVPRLLFFNKMDAHNADFYASLRSVSSRLKAHCLVLQVPLGSGLNYSGFLDVVNNTKLKFNSEKSVTVDEDLTSDEVSILRSSRLDLLMQLSETDEDLANTVLADDFNPFKISNDELKTRIKVATHNSACIPVCCGSALKAKAIDSLLDAICEYLPSPLDHKQDSLLLKKFSNSLCAYVFKIQHDKRGKPLFFVRVYAGVLRPRSEMYNATQKCLMTIEKIYRSHADRHIEVNFVKYGDIAVVSGLSTARTGDTLVADEQLLSHVKGHGIQATDVLDRLPVLGGIKLPRPVVFRTIESISTRKEKEMLDILERFLREDPSLSLQRDKETGQWVLGGMGDLHLEVTTRRLRREYGIRLLLGRMQIQYRETVQKVVKVSEEINEKIHSKQQSVSLVLTLSPLPPNSTPPLSISMSKSISDLSLLKALEIGIIDGCSSGHLLGYPLKDIHIDITKLTILEGTTPSIVSACASQCIRRAFVDAECCILQPWMSIQVVVPSQQCGVVVNSILSRNGKVQEVTQLEDNKNIVFASVPLSQLDGYAMHIRSVTHGTATFEMEFSAYHKMAAEDQSKLLAQLSG